MPPHACCRRAAISATRRPGSSRHFMPSTLGGWSGSTPSRCPSAALDWRSWTASGVPQRAVETFRMFEALRKWESKRGYMMPKLLLALILVGATSAAPPLPSQVAGDVSQSYRLLTTTHYEPVAGEAL